MHRLTKALLGSTCLTLLSTAAAEAVPMLEPSFGFGNTFSGKTLLPAQTFTVIGKVGDPLGGSDGSSSEAGSSDAGSSSGSSSGTASGSETEQDFLTFTGLKPGSTFTLRFVFDPPGAGSSGSGSDSGSDGSSDASSSGGSDGGSASGPTASETFVSFFDDLGLPIDLDGDPDNGIDNTRVGKMFDVSGLVLPSGKINILLGIGPDDVAPAEYRITLEATAVPEPSALAAIGAGAAAAAGLGFLRRRRRNAG